MAPWDKSGSIFALGLRLSKLNADGTVVAGSETCYVTDSLVQLGLGLQYTEPDRIEQLNGQGIVCVSYAPPPSVTNGVIEDFQVCTPDPTILQFCCGGNVITDGGTNEVQTVTITGSPTGGTFTLTFDGEETGNIAYNANAAAVQAALQALANIGSGNATVTGTGPYTVTFTAALGGQNVPQMTADGSGLTGGTSPAVGVATTTPGVSGDVIGYRAPAVGVDPTPYGVAIEAWSMAVIDGAQAADLPFLHWVIPRAKVRPSENLTLNGTDALTPQMEGTTEQNAGFGAGPLDDITFPTNRVWQFCRVATNPTAAGQGFVTVS